MERRRRNLASRLFLAAAGAALALALVGQEARSAGFAIREQSSSALGNAFAGATAAAEDLSYMFFNPAALARQEGSQVLGVASFISPQNKPDNMSASTVLGTPISGGNGGGDAGKDAITAALYAMWDISPELNFGLGVNIPWGLETDYDGGWAGRYHALNSELVTVNVNPALSYKVNDMFALAAGLQVQYVKARLSNAVDFGTIGFLQTGGAIGVPGAQDGLANLEADDVAFGFNLGVLFEPLPGTRLGAAYRSKISHKVEGDVDFTLDSAGTAATLQALAAGAGQPIPFVDTGVRASVTVPETASFGIYQELGPQWAVMAEAAWTRWNRFKELRIRFDNPGQPDNVTEEDWGNSWFVAAGVTYRPNTDWTLRAGVAFDESPIPDKRRTPRIAGNDRTWLAIGAGYRPIPNLSIDLGYTHIFVDDSDIDLLASDEGNATRGNLSGSYENSVDIVTLQLNYRF